MSKMHHIVTNLETGEVTITPMKARSPEEAREEMRALMDDCPLCQEQRALGKIDWPTRVISVDDLPITRTSAAFVKRPRWRHLKKHIRR